MQDWIYNAFVAPLEEQYFLKAMVGGSMVAVVCGVIGCLVILRKMAFLGDALSHAMIAGVAGGYLFMKVLFGIEAHAPAMLLGSLLAAILTVALIGFVSRVSRIKEDASIGIMYTGVFAAGVVLVSMFRNVIHIDLMHFIMGDVLSVSDADLWASCITAALVLSVIILLFRHFQMTTFDPVMAASIGLPVLLLDYLLTGCVSLVVVSAVSMVGVILVVGLLITPAATAYLLSDRLTRMMWLAAFFGLTSVVGGLYLCVWLDSAGGGAIMLFSTFQFVVVLFLAPRYGMLARWLRLRHMVPQELMEDLMVFLLRREGTPVALPQLEASLAKHGNIRRAIANLETDDALRQDPAGVVLTETGKREALRILRAHRLWETYLAHVGAPEKDWHPRAHGLEHMHDMQTMDYLDDLLVHPETDPHGSVIPSEPELCCSGSELTLSALRVGMRARIVRVEPSLSVSLAPEEIITVTAREEEGRIWVVSRETGEACRIPHHDADRIILCLLPA